MPWVHDSPDDEGFECRFVPFRTGDEHRHDTGLLS